MQSQLLAWLALPLLAVPVLSRPGRQLGAVAQLVIAVLGLAALQQGAGTLDPGDVRAMALQSPSDAWFAGLTLGVLVTGAALLPDPGNWRKLLAALPLLGGITLSLAATSLLPAAIGSIVGAVPATLGLLLPRRDPSRFEPSAKAEHQGTLALVFALVALVAAFVGPAAVAMAALVALEWRRRDGGIRALLLPVLATVAAAAWLWLALTIAGSPVATFPALVKDAPVSAAAGEWLAIFAVVMGVMVAAPWPLDRIEVPGVRLPVLAVVLFFVAAIGDHEGMLHWQPIVTAVLVIAALAASVAARWDGAAAALVLLAATRPGAGSLAAALVMASVPMMRRRIPAAIGLPAVGLAAGTIAASVLRDEVVLAIVLAFGLASVACTRMRVVAAPVLERHL